MEITNVCRLHLPWIPAFAGMTNAFLYVRSHPHSTNSHAAWVISKARWYYFKMNCAAVLVSASAASPLMAKAMWRNAFICAASLCTAEEAS